MSTPSPSRNLLASVLLLAAVGAAFDLIRIASPVRAQTIAIARVGIPFASRHRPAAARIALCW